MGFGGSGGGSGSVAGSSDVALNNPVNNNVLTYDSSSSKWKNAAGVDQSIYPVVVMHNANASMARPNVSNVVLWYGTVQPVNMINNDVWHVLEQV